MVTNGGFLVTKIKQLGDRIFEKVLAEKNIDAFNGPQGRILYVLWQQDGVPIKAVSDACGLAITSLTTMLERMENQGLIRREAAAKDRRKTLLYLTDRARARSAGRSRRLRIKRSMTLSPRRWGACTTGTLRKRKSGSSKGILRGFSTIWRKN